MPQTIRSARRAIAATLITASSSWLLAAAAPPVHPAATPPPGDVCTLLTKEDAAAALGETIQGPKTIAPIAAGAGGTVSMCKYTGSGMHSVQLNLTRLAASSVPMYRALCEKKNKDGLAGLGDVACWYNEKHGELHAIKGNVFLSVQLQRSGNPTEAIKGVMKKALDRLR